VMKIIKHCRGNLPELVTGQLLGLDFSDTLEVTGCFALLGKNFDGAEEQASGTTLSAEYHLEMMRCLREQNVDQNVVGWYQSAFLGSFFSEQLLDTQVNYQMKIKNSVVIIYDPFRTHNGALSLKAYRLADEFVELYQQKSTSLDALLAKHRLKWTDIFIEIPISIRNSPIVNCCLFELEQSSSKTDFDRSTGVTLPSINETMSAQQPYPSQIDVLDLNPSSFLEKNLECLIDSIEELGGEQNRLWHFQRKQQQLNRQREENEDFVDDHSNRPSFNFSSSTLKRMLKTNQINNYCRHINQFSGQTVSKLYLLNGLSSDDS